MSEFYYFQSFSIANNHHYVKTFVFYINYIISSILPATNRTSLKCENPKTTLTQFLMTVIKSFILKTSSFSALNHKATPLNHTIFYCAISMVYYPVLQHQVSSFMPKIIAILHLFSILNFLCSLQHLLKGRYKPRGLPYTSYRVS